MHDYFAVQVSLAISTTPVVLYGQGELRPSYGEERGSQTASLPVLASVGLGRFWWSFVDRTISMTGRRNPMVSVMLGTTFQENAVLEWSAVFIFEVVLCFVVSCCASCA